jgi:hypothetical protein
MIEIRPRDSNGSGSDPDGVRVVARPSAAGTTRVYQGAALLLASVCIGYLLSPSRAATRPVVDERTIQTQQLDEQLAEVVAKEAAEKGTKSPVAAGTAAAPGAATPPSARPVTPRRTASHRPGEPKVEDEEPPELPIPPDRLKDITMGEYIQALHDAGIHEGIGAFNPPGTSPPLEGVEVPEDYQLPEGYVRHYQTTDDGQAIAPILMYSPDYEFLDANGNPVPIPENRVVPADQVPTGMPVRPIQIPPPREPGDTAR